MSKNGNPRGGASQPPRKGSSLLAGILVGMVLGLVLAGGVAWYILKGPSPFVDKGGHEAVKLQPDPVKLPPVAKAPEAAAPAATSAPAASAVTEDKPRFEFYKVLTDKDKPDATAPAPAAAKQADKPAAKEREIYYLQAGAFTSAEDADKLKAKLAMLGMEASVQDKALPDKTVWHRVRLGPYKSADEMNKAAAQLKQNGVNATPIRNP